MKAFLPSRFNLAKRSTIRFMRRRVSEFTRPVSSLDFRTGKRAQRRSTRQRQTRSELEMPQKRLHHPSLRNTVPPRSRQRHMKVGFHPVTDNPIRMGWVPGWDTFSQLIRRVEHLAAQVTRRNVIPAPWEP